LVTDRGREEQTNNAKCTDEISHLERLLSG
jgi:hypothetical protein